MGKRIVFIYIKGGVGTQAFCTQIKARTIQETRDRLDHVCNLKYNKGIKAGQEYTFMFNGREYTHTPKAK